MSTRRLRESIVASAQAAKHLTEVGMLVEVWTDRELTMFTRTRTLPWQLGHGVWVINLEGLPSGYDCARVKPLAADQTEWIHVTFEDHGQDFTSWCLQGGVVQWCEPFQAEAWMGCKVSRRPIAVGDRLEIQTKHDRAKVRLNYPVEKVETVSKADFIKSRIESRENARKAVAA